MHQSIVIKNYLLLLSYLLQINSEREELLPSLLDLVVTLTSISERPNPNDLGYNNGFLNKIKNHGKGNDGRRKEGRVGKEILRKWGECSNHNPLYTWIKFSSSYFLKDLKTFWGYNQ